MARLQREKRYDFRLYPDYRMKSVCLCDSALLALYCIPLFETDIMSVNLLAAGI